MEVDRFIEERKGAWEELGRLLDAAEKRGLQWLKGEDLKTLGRLYRQAASDLALAQTSAGDPDIVRFLNDLVARAHGQIYRTKRSRLHEIGTFYLKTFPSLFRETLPSTLTAFSTFLFPALLGFLQASLDPPFTDFFVPPPLKESLEQGELWVYSINTIKPLATSTIMTNNLSVTFVAFAFGITFGVGTLYLMVLNGVLLGVTAALVARYGRGLEFWAFVLPHGVLELSAIFIAGGAGFLLASALLFPGDLTRRDTLVLKGHQAIRLILGCIPLLIVAGVMEGFVSPSSLPPPAKLALASSLALLLFLYLSH